MSYYAFGIGGTGAKCIESLVHVAAAGLIPGSEDLNVLFVDPDGANGSLGRATSLLKNYRECRLGKVGAEDLFKTKIEPLRSKDADENEPYFWSPLNGGKHQLDSFYSSTLLNDETSHLFNILFTPEEQQTNLDFGFRGRPAIGAAVMATAVDFQRSEPWTTIRQQMEADVGNSRPVKIVLFGSIFGGTGASGFPTIGKIIRDWVDQLRSGASNAVDLGGVLLLPYFSFPPVDGKGVAANSDDFLLNTQAALQYYANKNNLGVFDRTYLLGSEERIRMREAEVGGRLQENDPHFIELYAALAAIDFFGADCETQPQFILAARTDRDGLGWNDLPNSTEVQKKLMHLGRFSFSFLNTYFPTIRNIVETGNGYKAPWYIQFFKYRKVPVRDQLQGKIGDFHNYCNRFLLWLANLEFSVSENLSSRPNLIDSSSFATIDEDRRGGQVRIRDRFDVDGLDSMHLPGEGKNLGPVAIWDGMSNSHSRANPEDATWTFLNSLYTYVGKQ